VCVARWVGRCLLHPTGGCPPRKWRSSDEVNSLPVWARSLWWAGTDVVVAGLSWHKELVGEEQSIWTWRRAGSMEQPIWSYMAKSSMEQSIWTYMAKSSMEQSIWTYMAKSSMEQSIWTLYRGRRHTRYLFCFAIRAILFRHTRYTVSPYALYCFAIRAVLCAVSPYALYCLAIRAILHPFDSKWVPQWEVPRVGTPAPEVQRVG
jgi:hypothetical protein